MANKEKDIFEEEMLVVGVVVPPEVLSWYEEKEESNPGQVAHFLLELCPPLTGSVKVLEEGTGYWEDSGRWRVLLRVICKLSSQENVHISQLVVPRVAVPHSYKYFLGGTKVLFHILILDWDHAGFHKSGAHAPIEDMD